MSDSLRSSAKISGIVFLGIVFIAFISFVANTSHSAARGNDGDGTRDAKTRTLITGLWRTDGLFVSTIRIKNVLVTVPLEVQPVLYMADGTAYKLSPISVPNGGVSTININQALTQVPPSLQGHVSEYGSAALTYQYATPGHLSASVQLLDVTHSLNFVYSFFEVMKMSQSSRQSAEGLWWKRDLGVSQFLAISNSRDFRSSAQVQILDENGENQSTRNVELSAHSTVKLDFQQLDDKVQGSVGGIRVVYEGQLGSIIVEGGLENEDEGYSATMPFAVRDTGASAPFPITFGFAGLMVGKPNPRMMPGFPTNTLLSPYLIFRNTTPQPLAAAIRLNYMGATEPVNRNLPQETLQPFETKEVNLAADLKSLGLGSFDGNINLAVSYTGKGGDLLLASGSVDQTGTYVFEVDPQGVGPSRRKIGNYWNVADGNDTMFSLWNPTDESQNITATFYYGDGTGEYTFPIKLMAQGSTMIDMGVLIGEKTPDPNGNLIPPTVKDGSVSFLTADSKKRMTVVIAGGTFDVETATCGPICVRCCAITTPIMVPANPLIPVGQSMQAAAEGTDCTGGEFQLDPQVWSSSNGAAVTVSSSGVMTGVAAGTATITADTGPLDDDAGLCGNENGPPPLCPTHTLVAKAPATAQIPTSLSIVPGTDSTTAQASCTTTVAGKPATGCGVSRSFTYQVLDQNMQPIQQAGLEVWDVFGTPSPNPLSITGFVTTCSPANTGPCGKTTNSSGQFPEEALSICSTVCYIPSKGTCTTGGPSVVTQMIHVGPTAQINQTISYYCNKVLVNGN